MKASFLGVCLGLFYDLLRLLRILFCARRRGTAVFDLLFWLVLTGALFLFIMDAAGGIARSYVFLGAALGGCLYFLSLSGVFVAGGLKTARSLLSGAARLRTPFYKLKRAFIADKFSKKFKKK